MYLHSFVAKLASSRYLKSEVRSWNSEFGSRKSKSEERSQKVRNQKSEVRSPKLKVSKSEVRSRTSERID